MFRRTCTAALAALAAVAAAPGSPPPLPNGMRLSPALPAGVGVGSFPAAMALSRDRRWIAVTDTGYRESLTILDAATGRIASQEPFNGGRRRALYYGLAWGLPSAGSAPLYVSCGPDDRVDVFHVDGAGHLRDTGRSLDEPSDLPVAAGDARPNFIAGIGLSADGSRLYVANNETSRYTGMAGSVGVLDTNTGAVLGHARTGAMPYALAVVTRGPMRNRRVFVTSERDSLVTSIHLAAGGIPGSEAVIYVGGQPDALALDTAQRRLFVANAGSDTVSIIDTTTDRVTGTIPLRPDGAAALPGCTPTGLALGSGDLRLYVTLGDLDAVAVVDLAGTPRTVGYIPAGWYPTSVVPAPAGGALYVANAKGSRPRTPNGRRVGPGGAWGQYVLSILEGTVSRLPVPGTAGLRTSTRQALALAGLNSPLPSMPGPVPGNPRIRHVFYIIKENRTYDQVLGDDPRGNGDPSLALFGRRVTPNLHALAKRFVLLDNFFDCADVSADGWNWSTAAMASEYTVRNAPFNYSGRGRAYDFEGETNDAPIRLLGYPDVAAPPGGFLWNNAVHHRVTLRDYGVRESYGATPAGPGHGAVADNRPLDPDLLGRTDVDYRRFDTAYADSDAQRFYRTLAPKQIASYGAHGSTCRFREWKREFDAYCANGNLPALEIMALMRDHTAGSTAGQSTPRAMVADNDYGVGEIVTAISHSRYWRSSAIFILEDDSQAGHDHVDAHRAPCWVISPYVRAGTIDHHFYNTVSVIRTIEALLGLTPMCRFDATAPLFRFFTGSPVNAAPCYAILPPREIVAEVNTRSSYAAAVSARLDFTRPDRVPDALLNDIVWHSVRGAATPEPPARHAALPLAPHGRDGDG